MKKQRQRQQRLQLWLPVALVVLVIIGLTAGGIKLSLAQSHESGKSNQGSQSEADETKGGRETSGGTDKTTEAASGETDNTAEETEPGTTEPAEPETTQADYSEEQAAFDGYIANLTQAVSADSNYLNADNEELPGEMLELKTFERSHLTIPQQLFYDSLEDFLSIEIEGTQYTDVAKMAEGVPVCSVEGGADYYNYLLRKYSGLDLTWEELQPILADEVNANQAARKDLEAADNSLAGNSGKYTKQSPNEEYKYSVVTAKSDPLKLKLVNSGFIDGWTEFGVIRACLTDQLLMDNMVSYLVETARVTYGIYGIVDIYVNGGGWPESEVINLCKSYFGEAGGESFGTNVYQMVINSPGRYAAACVDYIQITKIEAKLAQTEGYTEAVLMDYLFNQGPASVRVLDRWAGVE